MTKLFFLTGLLTLTLALKVYGQNKPLSSVLDTDSNLLLEFDSTNQYDSTIKYHALKRGTFTVPVYFDEKNVLTHSVGRLNVVVDSLTKAKDSTFFLVCFLVRGNSQIAEYRFLYNHDYACLSAFKRDMKYDKEDVTHLLRLPASPVKRKEVFILIREFTCFTNSLWSSYH